MNERHGIWNCSKRETFYWKKRKKVNYMKIKKISFVVEAVGMAILFTSMSCDIAENPIVAIPFILGLLILALGAVLERSFKDAEKIIEKDRRTYHCSSDNDIVWLDFEDRSGTGRHMDM